MSDINNIEEPSREISFGSDTEARDPLEDLTKQARTRIIERIMTDGFTQVRRGTDSSATTRTDLFVVLANRDQKYLAQFSISQHQTGTGDLTDINSELDLFVHNEAGGFRMPDAPNQVVNRKTLKFHSKRSKWIDADRQTKEYEKTHGPFLSYQEASAFKTRLNMEGLLHPAEEHTTEFWHATGWLGHQDHRHITTAEKIAFLNEIIDAEPDQELTQKMFNYRKKAFETNEYMISEKVFWNGDIQEREGIKQLLRDFGDN